LKIGVGNREKINWFTRAWRGKSVLSCINKAFAMHSWYICRRVPTVKNRLLCHSARLQSVPRLLQRGY